MSRILGGSGGIITASAFLLQWLKYNIKIDNTAQYKNIIGTQYYIYTYI